MDINVFYFLYGRYSLATSKPLTKMEISIPPSALEYRTILWFMGNIILFIIHMTQYEYISVHRKLTDNQYWNLVS